VRSEWQEKNLGNVLTLEYGKPLPPGARNINGKYGVYGANGIKDRSDRFYIDKPSIIVGRKGSAGEIALTEDRFWPLDVTYFVTFDESKYDLQFLYHLLSLQELPKLAKGVKPGINRNEVYAKTVRVPSLTEQRRIVTILDEVFVWLATAIGNAERNLKGTRELFDSYVHSVFETSKDWRLERLGNVTEKITKGSSPKWQGISYVHTPGVLFVTSENVGINRLIMHERKYVDARFNEKDKKSILKKGDVLTNIVGASIGRTAIYELDDLANINQAVCLIRCNNENLNNQYLCYLLNSYTLRQFLHDNETNNARANLSLGFFTDLEIPLPEMSRQIGLVRQFDEMADYVAKLQDTYTQRLRSLRELRQSILHKAFSGKLNPPPSQTIREAAE
jgi:type I restriction enzyme S subunit